MRIIPCLVASLGFVWPAAASVLNMTDVTIAGETPDTLLSTSNTTFRGGFLNGALYRDASLNGSAGSGVSRDLYRISPPNGSEVEQGLNRPGVMDAVVPSGYDPYLKFDQLIQDASQTSYLFLIDINESGSGDDRYLSLDDFKIWVGGTSELAEQPATLSAAKNLLGVPAYDMNPSGQQNFVLLDSSLGGGSGNADLFIFVPKSFFPQNTAPDANIYVYTKMGGYTAAPSFGAGSGQEQVYVPGKAFDAPSSVSLIEPGVPMVPEPSTFAALLTAGLLGLWRRRR